MQVRIAQCSVELIEGDITQQQVDAIVNAANSELAGGSGVDGAIHRVGGPALMQETAEKYPNGCPVGSAVVTSAGALNAKYVFHAVGPVWKGGKSREPALLASAFRTCLKLAIENKCQSIAFPALSAGAYGYPMDLAASNSLKTTIDFIRWHKAPTLVRFVLFGAGAYGAWCRALEEVVPR